MTPPAVEPGLLIVDGNRLELLRDLVFGWIERHPLGALEDEVFLVQSNAVAEWLKMSMASSFGVCAAMRVELPGRFLWRAYRQVLGPERVVAQSALEREPLTWRLMRVLPGLLDRPAFAPVARYLGGRAAEQRLQLARRIAGLFEQYQVYRADWLAAWEGGNATLPSPSGVEWPLPDDQRWQPALWRAILDELDDDRVAASRPHVHRAFVQALSTAQPSGAALPRRVVSFGASHIAPQALEALVALSARSQVILAMVNPCRYHWADIIDGRTALRRPGASTRRHATKGARDLDAVPFEAMHLHAHPLLAAWGRQGRDFMQQLDAFDDLAAERRIEVPKVERFDEGPGTTLLTEVQVAIRDLVPLHEHRRAAIAADDRSIVFHVAHGVQREVEILHDQLLAMFAAHPSSTDPARAAPLRPRDVVVMVPDIELFAPAIRAVFGQYAPGARDGAGAGTRDDARGDRRFIPFGIADLKSRGSDPLTAGLEWLLRLPDQRIRLQEVRDLLDVPAAAARTGIAADALPGLFRWLAGAGVRWGLDERHRASLGLDAAGTQNTWSFGLRRMLLGYASGASQGFAEIEPYDEVGGLEAALLGAVVDLVERLEDWWSRARQDARPAEWATRARALLDAFFAPTDERERLTMAALEDALGTWLASCATAAFDERVPLAVFREAWLSGIDGLAHNRRFVTGGVTFCTLLPLRSVPFEVVCLLGMNDGDFPRAAPRSDFDLMGLPGQHRAGDRSRRDDDRYLMLEALLSARRTLYISWTGFNPRDDSAQPPSVLVAQLRDYLDAGWRAPQDVEDASVVAALTTVHPLQPFGRRYFEAGGPLTFATEWAGAHDPAADDARPHVDTTQPTAPRAIDADVTLHRLVSFLRNPVREFFRARLGVAVNEDRRIEADDEAFDIGGLAAYHLRQALVDAATAAPDGATDALVARRAERIRAAGTLPMFELGQRIVDEAVATVEPMVERWDLARAAFPVVLARRAVEVDADGHALEDWIDGLRSDGRETVRLVVTPSRLLDGKSIRVYPLIDAWVTMLAAAADGEAAPTTILIGCDATLSLAPLGCEQAAERLADLLRARSDGMTRPLPFAGRTAIAAVAEPSDPRAAASAYEGGRDGARAERDDFALGRLFADFEALAASGEFHRLATRLLGPLVEWVGTSATIEHHPQPRVARPSGAGESGAAGDDVQARRTEAR